MAGKRSANGRPLLTERFRTKLCDKFVHSGECRYGHRCMFAHGEHELRTKEMNVADDLTTDAAIKAFQRAREVAARARAEASSAGAAPPPQAPSSAASVVSARASCASSPPPSDARSAPSSPIAGRDGLQQQRHPPRSPLMLRFPAVQGTPPTANVRPETSSHGGSGGTSASFAGIPARKFRHDPYRATPTALSSSFNAAGSVCSQGALPGSSGLSTSFTCA